MMPHIKPEGKIIIGNFHPYNPSRHVMEFGEWNMQHRTEDDLLKLVVLCGCDEKQVVIDQEEERVNLFMRIY
ncbi:hypothetical protein ACFL6I_26260 [candidate division KSB1 bacterium]